MNNEVAKTSPAVAQEVNLWTAYVRQCIDDIHDAMKYGHINSHDSDDPKARDRAIHYRSAIRALWSPHNATCKILDMAGINLGPVREAIMTFYDDHPLEGVMLYHIILEGGKI